MHTNDSCLHFAGASTNRIYAINNFTEAMISNIQKTFDANFFLSRVLNIVGYFWI